MLERLTFTGRRLTKITGYMMRRYPEKTLAIFAIVFKGPSQPIGCDANAKASHYSLNFICDSSLARYYPPCSLKLKKKCGAAPIPILAKC